MNVYNMDIGHFDFENLFDRFPDANFVHLTMDLERVLVMLHHSAGFLRYDGPDDDIMRKHIHRLYTSSRHATASGVTMSSFAFMRS